MVYFGVQLCWAKPSCRRLCLVCFTQAKEIGPSTRKVSNIRLNSVPRRLNQSVGLINFVCLKVKFHFQSAM